MISAVTATGSVDYDIIHGSLDAAKFIDFCNKLLSTATTVRDLVGGSGWSGRGLGFFVASMTSAGRGRWCAGGVR
jgi:hypothetical protein